MSGADFNIVKTSQLLRAKLLCFVFLSSVMFSGCEGILKLDLVGDGNIITKKREIKNISLVKEVELAESFYLEIYQSDSREVFVEADLNLMPYIETIVEKEKLIIRRKSNFNLSPRKIVKIRLYINDLRAVSVSEGGSVLCDTLDFSVFEINNYESSSVSSRCITSEQFSYYSEGGASASIHGCFNKLDLRQVGSGELVVSGDAQSLSILQEGSGKVESYDLNVAGAAISLYGSGLIFCSATDQLNVRIIGKGRVYYIGSPNLTFSIEGGGLLLKESH